MEKTSMDSFIGRSVRIDRGGPESRSGKLIDVKDDHFVVYIENEGMIYYKNDHVKSLTLDTRETSEYYEDPETSQQPTLLYIDAENFTSLLQSMQFQSVQINRGGPEKIEGVMVDATDSEVTMIVGNELIKLLPFHIRNISYSAKNNNEQDNNNNSNSNNQKNSRNNRNSRR
ncbi:hypothetical protein [Brevibacillus sp. NRS-1366]|uniref:hypothetical protein n=1 Tax=Brevibacillus sp. NRS-1366 TaxID=3233899 RepID=UPI003D2133E2